MVCMKAAGVNAFVSLLVLFRLNWNLWGFRKILVSNPTARYFLQLENFEVVRSMDDGEYHFAYDGTVTSIIGEANLVCAI